MDHNLVSLKEAVSRAAQGPPWWMGHGGEFWQIVTEKGIGKPLQYSCLENPTIFTLMGFKAQVCAKMIWVCLQNFCLTQINYRVDHVVKKEIDLYYILLKIKIF